MRQPSSTGRQIAMRDNSNRRATCRASASMAPVVSVVSRTSRVRSKSRVTSFRRAIASRARSCAAADRLLAITATTRKANKAIQFWGSAMVKVPTGGRKKKLRVNIAATDATIATRSRPIVAVPRTMSRSASETVVGLMSGSSRSRAAVSAMAARLATITPRSRICLRRLSICQFCHHAATDRPELLTSYRLFTAFLCAAGYRGRMRRTTCRR